MACTVAVETVITQHYNDQLRVLQERGLLTGKYAELRQVFFDNPFVASAPLIGATAIRQFGSSETMKSSTMTLVWHTRPRR
jgi:hypothetical protein